MARNSVADVQIYLNPALIDLIKTAFFNGPTAFGYKFKKHYVTSHPERKEPELTIPVVALGATAVSNPFDYYNLTITDPIVNDTSFLLPYMSGVKGKRRRVRTVPRRQEQRNLKETISRRSTIGMSRRCPS